MAGRSQKPEDQGTEEPFDFAVPKYSWETETQIDDTFVAIPTYSWELENSLDGEDSSPKKDVADSYACNEGEHTKSSESLGSPKQEDVESYDFNKEEHAQRPESPDLNIDVDAILERFCKDVPPSPAKVKSDKCSASSSSENVYYDDAQRPESPDLNLDVDAIKRELCADVPEVTSSKRKGWGGWF